MPDSHTRISVRPVNPDNWREIANLTVTKEQSQFVADSTYYLALCCYSTWQPLAIYSAETVIGFMMWGMDDDKSCWLGGILIDRQKQGMGYGRKAVEATLKLLKKQTGASEFALSYKTENLVARHLYRSMGFTETGEVDGDEVVARLKLNDDFVNFK